MGKLTYALGSRNVDISMADVILRTVQAAVTGALHEKKSFFLRSVGDDGNGVKNITLLLNPSSQLAFTYDLAVLPDPDENTVIELGKWIDENGGIPLDVILAPSSDSTESAASQ